MENDGRIVHLTQMGGAACLLGKGRNLSQRWVASRSASQISATSFDKHAYHFRDPYMAPYSNVGEQLGTTRFLPTAPTRTRPPMVKQTFADRTLTYARHPFTKTKGIYKLGLQERLPDVLVDSPAPGQYYYMHSGGRPPTTYHHTRNCSNMFGPQVCNSPPQLCRTYFSSFQTSVYLTPCPDTRIQCARGPTFVHCLCMCM